MAALSDYCSGVERGEYRVSTRDFAVIWDELVIPPPRSPRPGIHQKQAANIPETNFKVATALPFEVSVPVWFPQMEYHTRALEPKSVLHWGQRKLFISELQFFLRVTRPGEDNIVVVYAGAASGEHLGALIHFLDLARRPIRRWVLFDRNPFRVGEHRYGRIYANHVEIRREYYTDRTSEILREQFRGARFLFISDIRSSREMESIRRLGDRKDPAAINERKILDAAFEKAIAENMRAQLRWYRALVGDRDDGAGLFKFRLPYASDAFTEYPTGKLLLPVWGPVTTTECRLLVEGNGDATTSYSHRRHEEQMFYFNNVYRTADHPHYSRGQYDTCYDCRAEVQCLSDFLFQVRLETSGEFSERLRDQGLLKDGEEAGNIVWEALEDVNTDLNRVSRDGRREVLDWVLGPFIEQSGEVVRLLPDIISALGRRLNSEIGRNRTLTSKAISTTISVSTARVGA